MKALNLFAALRTARWRAGTVALAICCGVAGAYLVTRLITPSYHAHSSVVLVYAAEATASRPSAARNPAGTGDQTTAQGGHDEATVFDLSTLQSMVPTVAHLAESRNVLSAAAKSAHLPDDQVVGRVAAAFEPGDTIITLTAAAPTATAASALANAVADVVHDQVSRGRIVLGRGGLLAAQPLDRANPPAAPTTPKPDLNLALGGMLGLLAGVAAVALGAKSDTRLRTSAQVEAELGLAILGTIPRTRRHNRGGARRELRRRRTATSVRATVATLSPLTGLPGRRLLVTCPTTCDAKTLVAALLALGFAEQELEVTVIDTELGRPRLATHFPESAAASLQRLLADNGQPSRTRHQTLQVVSAEAVSPSVGRGLLTGQRFREFITLATSGCDVVVLNGPPVLAGADLAALVEHVDSAILVVSSGSTRTSEARSAAQILSQFDIPIAGVVVANACDTDGSAVRAAVGQHEFALSATTGRSADSWHPQPVTIRQKPSEPQREAGSAPRW
jgi:succinoglycan biosynthesis transport protein ExoP